MGSTANRTDHITLGCSECIGGIGRTRCGTRTTAFLATIKPGLTMNADFTALPFLAIGALLAFIVVVPPNFRPLYHWKMSVDHSVDLGRAMWVRVRWYFRQAERFIAMVGSRRGTGESGKKPHPRTRVATTVRHPPLEPHTARLVIIPVQAGDIRIQRAVALLLMLSQRRRDRLGIAPKAAT